MTRVFLDANIVFSAAWRERNGLLRLWECESLHLISSSYALEEARRNLLRKRPAGVDRLNRLASRLEIFDASAVLEAGHGLPVKDRPIFAAAVAARCTVLLTGDITDFGHLIGASRQGVRVMTAAALLAEIRGDVE